MAGLSGRISEPVVGEADLIAVTLSLDTGAYADGDVMADLQAVTSFVREDGATGIIQSVTALDKDDQKLAFDILIGPTNTSLGTENSAPNISDANAEGLQRLCRIEVADYIDLGGCAIATKTGLGLVIEPAAGSKTMYVGTITRGAPTHTAAGVILYFGVLWN